MYVGKNSQLVPCHKFTLSITPTLTYNYKRPWLPEPHPPFLSIPIPFNHLKEPFHGRVFACPTRKMMLDTKEEEKNC